MINTFPDFPIDPSSIDGLEPLFTVNSEIGDTQEVPDQKDLPTPPPTKGIPIKSAAASLGISPTSILKRLRKGTLRGFKEVTKYGERWMVLSDELEGTTLVGDTQEVPTSVGPSTHNISTKINLQSTETPYANALLIEHLEKEKQKLEQQVQALTWRNGYLESKVEEQTKSIKLLEDQRKAPWLQSLWFWFIGTRG